MFINTKKPHSIKCKSMLFVTNHIPYLWGLSNSFSSCFTDFTAAKLFHQVIWERTKPKVSRRFTSIMAVDMKLWIYVTSCIEQIKKRKQTLESAQYGPEIIFKFPKAEWTAEEWKVKRGQRKQKHSRTKGLLRVKKALCCGTSFEIQNIYGSLKQFPTVRFWWIIITSLYHSMLQFEVALYRIFFKLCLKLRLIMLIKIW